MKRGELEHVLRAAGAITGVRPEEVRRLLNELPPEIGERIVVRLRSLGF